MSSLLVDPPDRRPLSELPSLVLADANADVRRWEVRDGDGQPIGTVVDLLVDVDRLTADYLAVATSDTAPGRTVSEVFLPVASLTRDETLRRLVPGMGMAPIKLRYRSTVGLVAWAAVAVAIMMALAWALGIFDF